MLPILNWRGRLVKVLLLSGMLINGPGCCGSSSGDESDPRDTSAYRPRASKMALQLDAICWDGGRFTSSSVLALVRRDGQCLFVRALCNPEFAESEVAPVSVIESATLDLTARKFVGECVLTNAASHLWALRIGLGRNGSPHAMTIENRNLVSYDLAADGSGWRRVSEKPHPVILGSEALDVEGSSISGRLNIFGVLRRSQTAYFAKFFEADTPNKGAAISGDAIEILSRREPLRLSELCVTAGGDVILSICEAGEWQVWSLPNVIHSSQSHPRALGTLCRDAVHSTGEAKRPTFGLRSIKPRVASFGERALFCWISEASPGNGVINYRFVHLDDNAQVESGVASKEAGISIEDCDVAFVPGPDAVVAYVCRHADGFQEVRITLFSEFDAPVLENDILVRRRPVSEGEGLVLGGIIPLDGGIGVYWIENNSLKTSVMIQKITMK